MAPAASRGQGHGSLVSIGLRLRAALAGVVPLLLEIIVAAVDGLVVLRAVRTLRRAEVPRALVADLIAAVVIPGIEQRIGDALVLLVRGHVEGGIGCRGAVGVLPAATGAQVVSGVRHVGVDHGLTGAVRVIAMIGAELGEGAAATAAGADAVAQEDEVLVANTGRPVIRRDRLGNL